MNVSVFGSDILGSGLDSNGGQLDKNHTLET